MENKKLVVDNMLCMACLCIGRTLHNVTDRRMQQCYLEILNEIPLCNVPQVCPSICWECIAMLKKAVQFKEQVKDSYRILQTYTTENLHECLLSDITRTPRLKVHNTEPVSIPDSDAADKKSHDVQLVYVKDEMKNETKNDESDDLVPSEDDRPLSVSSANIGALEVEIDNLIHKRGKKRKKTVDVKVKKAKKIAKRLKNEKKLKQHLKAKAEQKIVTVELSYEEMLLEREREATRESFVKSEYKCESCLLGFNYLKSYKAHVTSKHSEDLGNYSCPICKTVIPSVESFTAHYKRHMRRYECSICHKRTLDMKVMQQHYYSTHEISLKEYKCNLCGKISNSVDTHRYHKDSHKARVPCPDCDKTFSHRAGLMNHRLAVHEFNNEFPCTVCEKVFRWKNSLKRHLEKHDLKSNQLLSAAFCSPCGISFSSVSSHQRHLRTSLKHVTAHELRFTCDHCGRRFADKTKLRDHIEEKHLHRTYQCSICLKPSKNRVGLDQHIRNVHKGRPNNKICHHCGKGFPTKVQLESHIRSHTGEKPFICEFCPTTFSQQSNLYKHNRQVHLNIKSKRYPITKKRKVGALEAPAEPYQQRPLLQYSPERGFVI